MTNTFQMDESLVRSVVMNEDGLVEFGEVRHEIVWETLDKCPRVEFEGREFAITGPIDEITIKWTKVPEVCRHYWRVLAVELVSVPEPDGRFRCTALLCEKIGANLWKVNGELDSSYTDSEDTEEFGSHPVWNPATGRIERSTEEVPMPE